MEKGLASLVDWLQVELPYQPCEGVCVRFKYSNARIVLWMILAVLVGEARLASAGRNVTAKTIDDLYSEVARAVPEFGGMFIDSQGQLAIYLTDERQLEAAKTSIVSVFGRDRFDMTRAVALRARYTFTDLRLWHNQHRLETLAIPGVVLTSIHKSSNRLRVGVVSGRLRGSVETVLARAAIPADAVEIVEMEPLRMFENLTDTRRPILGGLQIGGCTLGFLAVVEGKAGFFTNSHCTAVQGGVEGTVFHQSVQSGNLNRIGVELLDPPFLTGFSCPSGMQCRFSDAAFVARDGGSDPATPRTEGAFGHLAIANSSLFFFHEYEIVDKVFTPIDGEAVEKVGKTSGTTTGTVSDTCADVNPDKTNIVLFCQHLADQTGTTKADEGDSGSAVYRPYGTPVSSLPAATLYGLLWGGNEDVFGFSSVANLELEFGSFRAFPGDPGANSAPEVKITQPLDLSQVGVGGLNSVEFEADIVDYEGCCQSVTWTSDVDGEIGHGPSMEFTFPSPGMRTITVTVTDDGGATASDSIKIAAGTSQPVVTIVKPISGQTVFRGVLNVFSATSLDPNAPFFSMPCSALTWTSTNVSDPFPVTGCNPQVTFQTVGYRVLTLTGKGAFGLKAVDYAGVTVTNAPATNPPAVTILNPLDDDLLSPSTSVTLTGTVQDPANAGSLSYKWVLINGSTQTVLGTGSVNSGGQITLPWTPGNNVSFHCGGRWVTLKLEVTSPNTNQTGSDTVEVKVSYPTC